MEKDRFLEVGEVALLLGVSALRVRQLANDAAMAREVDGVPLTREEVQPRGSELTFLRQEAWKYSQRTGRCAFCGQPGPYHAPARSETHDEP